MNETMLDALLAFSLLLNMFNVFIAVVLLLSLRAARNNLNDYDLQVQHAIKSLQHVESRFRHDLSVLPLRSNQVQRSNSTRVY